MFNFIQKFNKDEIAKMIKTDKRALEEFERVYRENVLSDNSTDDFLKKSAKDAILEHSGVETDEKPYSMIERIVEELINVTPVIRYDGKKIISHPALEKKLDNPVTNTEISQLPEGMRPWLTGSLMKVDIDTPSYLVLCELYEKYCKEKNPVKKMDFYNHFRQGLDILDIDGITYQMIDQNQTSIGHWLPQIAEASALQDFFKIPKTTIIKVPASLLQLTRLEYSAINRTTLDIVDKYCYRVFQLNQNEEYFIKTGTYSSKYDFRNAHIHDPKEVREIGEYLLFIHNQGIMMASPLMIPCRYGVSTTTEWVVREYIKDKEDNPCIYNGLPLHTEYRMFVDFDIRQVIGMNPYWDPEVMKRRFGDSPDADDPKNIHDYITYTAHEDILMDRYNQNKDLIWKKTEELIENVSGMNGQWSLDIMQNGDDFWIIDMAPASISALNECVPKDKLRANEEFWIPEHVLLPER